MLNSTKISAKFELNTELLSNIYLNLITIFSEPRCDYISPAVARRSAACGSPVILTSSSHASHLHQKRVAAHVRACVCARTQLRKLYYYMCKLSKNCRRSHDTCDEVVVVIAHMYVQ